MSLFCLPRSKFSLAFLAVPAGKDGRVECPCQTVNDFIGVGGSVCGLFLFVQTHAPLIVPLRQSRARKSKFQFLSGARARRFSALYSRFVDSFNGLQVPVVMRSFQLLRWFQKGSAPCRLPARSDSGLAAAWRSGEPSAFPGQKDNSDYF